MELPAGIEARWLGEGILQLLPTAPWRQATILSAGVHGNETAPTELLLQLTHDLSQGRQPLTQALLIVLVTCRRSAPHAAICTTT
ncbi:succinylglutamate desuccinylase [Klebsiella variicola]|nr:succinylglutamate desuccinylase [Klebsiella variicola]